MLSKVSPFIKGSFFLLIGYNVFNIFNFLFQFFLAYALTKEEYGVFAALLPFVYIIGAVGDGVQTVTAVKVAKSVTKKGLNTREIGFIILLGTIFCVIALGCAPFIAKNLKTSVEGVIIVGFLGITTLIVAATRGILQGAHNFKDLMFSLIGESGIKLLFVVVLVSTLTFAKASFLAITSIFLASLLTGSFLCYTLKEAFMNKASTKKISFPSIEIFSLLVSIAIIGFYSIDLIIARLVLPEALATEYAYLALIGKTVLWGILPISKAMLPLVTKGNMLDAKKLLSKTLIYTVFLGILGVVLFTTFPDSIIKIFTGKLLTHATETLGKVTLTMFLLAVANIFLLFGAARVKGKKRNVILLTCFLLFFWTLEAGGLYYGGTSLIQFVNMFLGIGFLFTLSSYFFLVYLTRFDKNETANS